MSNWTHPQCEACWIASETTIVSYGTLEIRRPHMLIGPGIEMCCYCGKPTIVGIYRRALALWIRRVPLHRHVRATPIEVST